MLISKLNKFILLKNINKESILNKCYSRKCSSRSTSEPLGNIKINNINFPNKRPNLTSTNISYGQPTPATHPHLLRNGEVVPLITTAELQMRRNRLMEQIQMFTGNTNKNITNHIVIIPSAIKRYMSDKIPYVFRQNSDFLYFSGCLEPDSILVVTSNDRHETNSILFMRPKDKHAELWDGPRTGVEVSPSFFGVNESHSIKDFQSYITSYMHTNKQNIGFWYDSKTTPQLDISTKLNDIFQNITPNIFDSPTKFFHQLRVIKSTAEIDLMRITCDIGSNSMNSTISNSKPDDSEHHLFARVDYYSRMYNADYLAYPPVVAAGKNATIIHYVNNSQIIKDGEMVLMDAGCEYGGYCSDITRTWPINGTFTQPQQIVYEVLLALQKDLLNNINKKGGENLDQLFDTMCLKLGLYLQEIGLIDKQKTNLDLAKAAYSFCPHHVSHYLGMDVHDTPLISRSINLLPGMICTVEPGIYISEERTDVPEEFRGIGLRIEDDILIKENSIEILTHSCVKEIDDIKKLINL